MLVFSSLAVFLVAWSEALRYANSSTFVSMKDVNKLVRAHNEFVVEASNLVDKQHAKLTYIQHQMANMVKFAANLSVESEDVNPIDAFKLTRHLFWCQRTLADAGISDDSLNELLPKLPTEDDVIGHAVAIHRIIEVYRLTPAALQKGEIFRNSSPLDPDDCFELGLRAYNEAFWPECVAWTALALTNITSTHSLYINCVDYMAFCLYKVGDIASSYYWTKMLVRLSPNNERFEKNVAEFSHLLHESPSSSPLTSAGDVLRQSHKWLFSDQDAKYAQFYELCRAGVNDGSFLDSVMRKFAHRRRKLRPIDLAYTPCVFRWAYVSGYQPKHLKFRTLVPFRAEYFHVEPDVIAFHNVISAKEIDLVKNLASPHLDRATVVDHGQQIFADYRIAKTAWLQQNLPIVRDLYGGRVSAATGLEVDTAEDFQIGNYGVGGHYLVHHDTKMLSEEELIDTQPGTYSCRQATWMFYLSDVQLGGGTAFSHLDLVLRPAAGSAVFWSNVRPDNGLGDTNMHHGGCPVLHGSKWVGNVWINQKGQRSELVCRRAKS